MNNDSSLKTYMKTINFIILWVFLSGFCVNADTAFLRKIESATKETPKETRAGLRVPTVTLSEFDGVKLDMTVDNQVKVAALFKYLKRKDPAAWTFVKKNISSVKIMDESHPNYNNSLAMFAPLLKRASLHPKWVNQIKPNEKVPLVGPRVTTIVHEASHSDIYHNQKRPKHTEAEADAYRVQVQKRIDANPL